MKSSQLNLMWDELSLETVNPLLKNSQIAKLEVQSRIV